MKFDEITVGQEERLTHKVTQSDINKFVDLSGDDNKLHVDKQYAAKTSFKKPVVHGMIGASFISTIIGTKLPGDGALWYSQTLEFLLPVRIDDVITVVAQVTKKIENERVIELKVEIFNQNRQVVTRGISKVKVLEEIVVTEHKQDLIKRTALIIGGTGGIGKAVARQLAKDGFAILLHYHSNTEAAQALKREFQEQGTEVAVFCADIRNEKSIDELIGYAERKFSGIDVLINCAASPIPTIKISDLLWSDIEAQLEMNIRVNLMLIQKVLPHMIEKKFGKIIMLGTSASDKPNVGWAHYITAKSALEGFTKAVAFELAPKGIRINMVSPSLVSTDLTADVPEKVKLMTAAQTPLRRLATSADVAGAVSFLASEKADFITGEILRLNGGQVMK